MNKFYLLIIAVLLGTAASAQKKWDGGAGTSSWADANNWTSNSLPTSTDNVVFDNGISLSITNVPNNTTVRSLTVTNTTTISLSAANGNQSLTIGNGTGVDLVIDNGSSLTIASTLETITLANGATATISGVLSINNTFNADGASNNAVTTISSTGTLENKNTVTSSAAGRIIVQNGGTYIHAINGGDIPYATWGTSSNCNVTGMVGDFPSSTDQTFGNLTWNSPSQTSAGFGSSAGAIVAIAGNLSIQNTGSGDFRWSTSPLVISGNYSHTGGKLTVGGLASKTLTVNGNFSISGGTIELSELSSGTLNIKGNFTQSAGTIQKSSGTFSNGTIVFQGTTEQVVSRTGGTLSGDMNFTVNSGAIVNLGTSIISGPTGDFTVSSGAKVITSHADGLRLSSALGSVRSTGTRSYNAGADYEFRGASTGDFAPIVRNLTINNTSGAVTLTQAVTVNGALTLTAGLLNTTSTNLLTIAAGGSASAATSTSFVNGPMAKAGTTAFTFPVGKSGAGYRNIGITTPSSSSNFRAEFFRADPRTLSTTLASGITQISSCEYWTLDRVAGSGIAQVVLSWESLSPCTTGGAYVTDLTTLRVAHLTGGTWANEGRFSTSGSTTSGTITSGNTLTSFSPFSLASSTTGTNPLPVTLADVKAYVKNNGVQLEWSNLTEIDVVAYTIERSANGTNFTAISQQLPKSNQNDKASYTSFDAAPLTGVSYYRIKVAESNGKITYSRSLRVEIGNTQKGFSVYPNPVVGGQFTISLTGLKQGQYNLRIVNAVGQEVYSENIQSQSATITQTIQLPSVKPGMYTSILTGSDYRGTKSFIVQ